MNFLYADVPKKKLKKFIILICFFILRTIIFSAGIHDIIKKGDVNKLKDLLVQDKTLVNLKDTRGNAPLHYAVQINNSKVAVLLLKNGADINVRDINGVTPLHYAAFMGYKNIVKLLIKHKANLDIQSKAQETALDFALARKHKDIVNLLIQNGIKINIKNRNANFIHMVAVNGYGNLLNVIIKNGADLTSLNIFGGTMLHSAVLGNLPKTVKLIISKKIKINYLDKYGKTALYYAKNNNNKEIISMLKKSGAKDIIEKKSILKGEYFGQKKPELIPVLFAPQLISRNGSNDRDIAFTKNGDEFYFTKNSKIMAVKRINEIWSVPKKASFSSQYDEAEAYFTPDNKKIYFISKRPKKGNSTSLKWDIWVTERTKGVWSKAKLIDSQFKGCFYTSFTKKWKMYYTGYDNNIYTSQYTNGAFEKPRKLGVNINTDKGEYNAFIAPDETYLIFTSFGWGEGLGNGDLFISFKNRNNKWKKPVNMGKIINSKYHDYCPSVSPDGKYFFFTSNRLGNEDIYWVSTKIIKRIEKNFD